MKYRLLGKSGLRISEISFGCMSLGDNHEENATLLHQAIDEGINFFDTADVYQNGFNETTVGRAFKEKRSQIILATKVGNQRKPDGSGFTWNPTKSHILKSVDASLRRLQTDYIDLYQLHGGTIEDPIDETIEAFEELLEAGKIRYYGISSIRPNVIRAYATRSNSISVMMQYSLLDRRPEETCLPLLKKSGIGVLARGSLAKGLLAGKPPTDYLDYQSEEIVDLIKEMKTFSGEDGMLSDLALSFVLRRKEVSSAVVGIRTKEHLRAATNVFDQDLMQEEEWAEILKKVKINTYRDHR